MVNNTIVSRYGAGTLPWEASSRKISAEPLYPRQEILKLLSARGGSGILLWTRRCLSDVQTLELNNDDLAVRVVHALNRGYYLGSEWCQQHEEGPWAACDAYRFLYQEWIPKLRKDMEIEYYVKLAISKTGTAVLLVSFHLPS